MQNIDVIVSDFCSLPVYKKHGSIEIVRLCRYLKKWNEELNGKNTNAEIQLKN